MDPETSAFVQAASWLGGAGEHLCRPQTSRASDRSRPQQAFSSSFSRSGFSTEE